MKAVVTEITVDRGLRPARLAAGLSQAEVGRRLGTSKAHVACLEAAKDKVTVLDICRYSQALGGTLRLTINQATGEIPLFLED